MALLAVGDVKMCREVVIRKVPTLWQLFYQKPILVLLTLPAASTKCQLKFKKDKKNNSVRYLFKKNGFSKLRSRVLCDCWIACYSPFRPIKYHQSRELGLKDAGEKNGTST